jgi:glutathione S-transferase
VLELYYAPLTRAIRVLWLLEELSLPYRLHRVIFRPTVGRFFQQDTPTGKLPTLVDGDVVMCESGAIVEYVIERHGAGRLAPAPEAPDRAAYLQWLHFAEATAFAPLGNVAWLSRYRGEGDRYADLIHDSKARAASGLALLEENFADGRPFLLGSDFSGADVMLGFTLASARVFGVLDARFPKLGEYYARLEQRPAFQIAIAPPD